VSGIHVLIDVIGARVRRGQSGRDRGVHVGCQFRVDAIEQSLVGDPKAPSAVLIEPSDEELQAAIARQ